MRPYEHTLGSRQSQRLPLTGRTEGSRTNKTSFRGLISILFTGESEGWGEFESHSCVTAFVVVGEWMGSARCGRGDVGTGEFCLVFIHLWGRINMAQAGTYGAWRREDSLTKRTMKQE